LNPSFDSARAAAHAVSAHQHYPPGALYLVASPIGNLADISLRSLHLLSLVDTVACEDTRQTQQLFRSLGLETSRVRWVPVHQHNEREGAEQIVALLHQGQRVAYVSDAGTPGISDPGSRLVRAALEAGLKVVPLPGPSSVTTLLSASGAWVGDRADFVFAGFLPSKGQERGLRLRQMLDDPRPQCVLEAPHRIAALAQELGAGGARGLTVGRELSKQFEEVALMRCDEFAAWLAASPHRAKGEFALVLHESPVANESSEMAGTRELRALLPHLPLKTAVQVAAELSGGPRKGLYALALAWQKDEPGRLN
jgi:16S rRNA (cytidine1402-2'-O)-methyltransferase